MQFILVVLLALLTHSTAHAESWSCVDSNLHTYTSSQNVPSDKCTERVAGNYEPQQRGEPLPLPTRSENGTSSGFALLAFLFIAGMLLYFAPTIRAKSVEHPDTTAIFVLNFLLGWLFIPWVIALVWSYKGNHKAPVGTRRPSRYDAPTLVATETHKACPFCAEEIKVEAIRCKHCQADLASVV